MPAPWPTPSRPSSGATVPAPPARSASTAPPPSTTSATSAARCPALPVAAAIAAAVGAGGGPDAILIPATYDGRDIAGRLSVKLDRPVLTNVVGLTEADGGLVSQHAIFGGAEMLTARFTAEGPAIFVIRAKSFAAEPSGGAAAAVVAARRSRHRRHQRRPHRGPPRRGADRAEAGRGRRGRVRWSRPGREGAVRPDRAARRPAARCGRCQPGHRRRRLGAVLAPGRPDRQDRQADGLHGLRDLGGHPAHGRHEELEEHRGDQQGPGRTHLPGGRPRHRRRRPQGRSRSSSRRCRPVAEPPVRPRREAPDRPPGAPARARRSEP